MAADMQIHTIVSPPFAQNASVLWRPSRTDAIIVDPGFDTDSLFEFLADQGLTPAAVLLTHGHADHIAGNAEVKQRFPDAPILIGVNDVPLLSDPYLNVSQHFDMSVTSPPADRTVRGGEVLELAGLRLEVRDVPGHSPGHVVYVVADHTPTVVIGGDVLFRGAIGRTDLPGGNFETLARGIRSQLYTLPADTVVYPGHGPTTTIGYEMANNPFVPA